METKKVGLSVLGGLSCAVFMLSSVYSSVAAAHGYMANPPSRAYACAKGLNLSADCGAAQYEPQSVGETVKGFPAAGPADGKLASGGNNAFAQLDVQAANRWYKTKVASGAIDFGWHYAAGHNTTRWEYFITRSDWNPNLPLTRAAFDPGPFCTVQWNATPPFDKPEGSSGPGKELHHCQLPADRRGDHVIYAIWTVDNTANAFYNVVDVTIGDGGEEPGPQWDEVGRVQPQRELSIGDQVTARAFVAGVENPGFSTTLKIASAEQGQPANWSYALAKQINLTQTQVKAGLRDSQGEIMPNLGSNTLFAKPASGISSFELAYDLKPIDEAYLQIQGLKPDYPLSEGKATLDFQVLASQQLDVRASLYDSEHKQVGTTGQAVDAGTTSLQLNVQGTAGKHLLKLIGTSKQGRTVLQDEREVQLSAADSGGYDFSFPEEIGQYSAGTRVLQVKNGKVYECQPFPYEGFCRQYSPTANGFEPGVGSDWRTAWIER